MKWIIFIFTSLVITACNDGGDSRYAELGNKMEEVQEQIRNLGADKACATDQQCTHLEFGKKYCGTPQSYLPASIASPNYQKALQLTTQYNELHDEQSRLPGAAFICSSHPMSPPVCEKQVCRLNFHPST